ncbi:MAG: 5'/3'-nucleotidase SurE [Nitriliruptoraceae bacterium]
MTDPRIRPEVDVDTAAPAEEQGRRLLLTNDDGIDAPGLAVLAHALAEHHDVVVVAPASDVSGAGTSMGPLDAAEPIRLQRRDLDGLEAYALDGPPGLAVLAAALGAFGGPPEVVVSGPNAGLNTGRSIIHSGTVGAALTGRTFGSKAVAFSVAPGDRWHWETAAAAAPDILSWVLAREEATTLNVNVPAVAVDQVRGARWATIEEFGHFSLATLTEGGSALDLDVRDRSEETDPDSDTALCLAGYVTLTLLTPVAAEPAPAHVAASDVLPWPAAGERPPARR